MGPVCHSCQSSKTWLDGKRYVQDRPIQRYLCRVCGYRFSESHKKEQKQTRDRQICVPLTEDSKNLTRVKKEITLQENMKNTKGQLVNFSLQLLRDGKSESTIETYTKLLKVVNKHADLLDPEAVKSVIATKYKDRNTKRLIVNAYDSYIKFVGGKWNKPKYRKEHKQVFIPTETELKFAINTGTKQTSIFSLFLYETGARLNEAERLEWTDLDKSRMIVSIKASKNGDPRKIRISENLLGLLFSLPKTSDTFVFVRKKKNARSVAFHQRMKRLANKQNNPRYLKIHPHTFRHCKALREYHKTRDILHVMSVLGHRSLVTAYRYVRLYKQTYQTQKNIKYVTKIASTKKERCELINNDWQLVGKDGEDWYFRKPDESPTL